MKKFMYGVAAVAVLALISFSVSQTADSPAAQTKAIVTAANEFLTTLSATERQSVQLEFLRPKVATGTQFDRSKMGGGKGGPPGGGPPPNGDTSRRSNRGGGQRGGGPSSGEKYGNAVWSNFPITFTTRPGIEMGKLTAKQKAAAMHLLQVTLSPAGYQKVQEIMGSDQALTDAGTDFESGRDHYLIAIFGTPDATKPWMIEFGGHHLGLNVVIAGAHGALTPTLTGAQPSVYTENGKTIRVLAKENDKAFDLLNALDAGQRKKAILNYQIGDLVVGPGHDGQAIVPEGLKGSEMTAKQKELMLGVISEWAGIINHAYQNERLAELKAGLDDTYFAWSGPLTHEAGKNGSAYYRIQGPKVIIEFSPQATFGDATIHVHTIYRDPANEYGAAYMTQ